MQRQFLWATFQNGRAWASQITWLNCKRKNTKKIIIDQNVQHYTSLTLHSTNMNLMINILEKFWQNFKNREREISIVSHREKIRKIVKLAKNCERWGWGEIRCFAQFTGSIWITGQMSFQKYLLILGQKRENMQYGLTFCFNRQEKVTK